MHQIRRKHKVIASILLCLIGCGIGWWFWNAHEEWLDGFDAAGIAPIPGAKLFTDDYSQQDIMGGNVFWVYQLPATYTNELYKDCSRIGYETGVVIDNGKPVGYVGPYYKPGMNGCNLQKDKKGETIFVQFVGDKLVVEDSF
jgi:hypothetical protein